MIYVMGVLESVSGRVGGQALWKYLAFLLFLPQQFQGPTLCTFCPGTQFALCYVLYSRFIQFAGLPLFASSSSAWCCQNEEEVLLWMDTFMLLKEQKQESKICY